MQPHDPSTRQHGKIPTGKHTLLHVEHPPPAGVSGGDESPLAPPMLPLPDARVPPLPRLLLRPPPLPPERGAPLRPPLPMLVDTPPGFDFGGGASTHAMHGPQLPEVADFASLRHTRVPRLPGFMQSHRPESPILHDDAPADCPPPPPLPPLPAPCPALAIGRPVVQDSPGSLS